MATKAPAPAAKTKKQLPSLVDLIEEAYHSTGIDRQKDALIAVAKRVEALEQQ